MAEWDSFWQRADKAAALAGTGSRQHPRIAAFWASLASGAGPRCVDLASGSGGVFACLPEALAPGGTAEWVALDISTAAVRDLMRRFPGVAGLVADGETRVDRIQTLEAALRGLGVKTRLDIMPGVSHDSVKASNRTRDFFLDVLQGRFPET